MSHSPVKVVLLLANYGHDPTETAVPFDAFKNAGYEITVATQNGAVPACDSKMLTGWTQTFLGADKQTISLYDAMTESAAWKSPRSYSEPSFSLDGFDLVFLPGGHDKGIRQLLDDKRAHELLVSYFPQTLRSNASGKYCAAVCHGVQLLAHARDSEGKSVLYNVETTCLPDMFENSVHGATKLFLGDYYKTYGSGTDNVAEVVRSSLADPAQYKSSNSMSTPFTTEDPKYRYWSGRWPGDAKVLADQVIEAINASRK
jgi:putative intracellular protease/amidase